MSSRAFVVGAENHLVPVVLDDFLSPETRFSPIVIYGPLGSGKTHLAELIAATWNANQEQTSRAQHVTVLHAADLFTHPRGEQSSDHESSLNGNAPIVFLNVDEIARNARWQKRLTRLLDEWTASGRRVLLTSRTHPGETSGLDARLRSRLLAGLCVGLESPREETRKAMLENWAAEGEVDVSPEAIAELAGSVTGPPARLKAVFSRLIARQLNELHEHSSTAASKSPHHITLSQADVVRFLQGKAPAKSNLPISLIAKTTARYFATTLADLRSPSRRKSTVLARSIAMYLTRQLAGKSLAEIGKNFGGRDHTTVLHSVRKIETALDEDQAITEAVHRLTELLGEDF